MKNFIFIFVLLLFGCSGNSPNKSEFTSTKNVSVNNHGDFTKSKDSLISLLPKMKAESLDCNADIYWRIISRGQSSIPLLIESLTDTTLTNVYNHCKKGRLNVAEVSYFALEELAEFPAFLVTQIQYDVYDENGCWSFFDDFFDNSTKKSYQKKIMEFYNSNNYVFVKFNNEELNECRKKYKISGKLKLKEYYQPLTSTFAPAE